jgi:Holliday junction resolvasome RuvABC DNA-binding subunit
MKKGIKENDSILMKELFSLGQRKAQAIIFEVSRKIKTQPKKLSQNDEEVMKALVKLGFKRSEVKDAVIDLSDSSLAIETKIKKILKSFNEK